MTTSRKASDVRAQLRRASEDSEELITYLSAVSAQLDIEIARLVACDLSAERLQQETNIEASALAAVAYLEVTFDEDLSTVSIEPTEAGDAVYQDSPCMTADQAAAFAGRYAVPGSFDSESGTGHVDLIKLRAELSNSGRPIDAVYRISNAGTDVASKRDLVTLRDIVRSECPDGRFVALGRQDGSDYWQIDAVLDAAGDDADFDPCRMIGSDHPESLVQSAAETGFAAAWSHVGGRDANLEADLVEAWKGLYETVIDLDDLSRR